MINILANDGISISGIEKLERDGFNVDTDSVLQDELADAINKRKISVILVRSATKITKEIIDKCPNLKIIGRGGVGMDNINVMYAEEKGILVINTPAASSSSVAELVFAHLFGMVRFLYASNRQMPIEGDSNFKTLKKTRIGQEVAKRGIGLGMNVIAHDKFTKEANITINFFNGDKKTFTIETQGINDILKNADFITLHIPKISDKAVIGAKEIGMMKTGSGIINTSRGGIIDETALMFALDKQKLSYAGLDVYENEPTPSIHLVMHSGISLTPHIGAATLEAQDRIGIELAEQIITYFK